MTPYRSFRPPRHPRCHKASEPGGPCCAIRPFPDRDELSNMQMLQQAMAGKAGNTAGVETLNICSGGGCCQRTIGGVVLNSLVWNPTPSSGGRVSSTDNTSRAFCCENTFFAVRQISASAPCSPQTANPARMAPLLVAVLLLSVAGGTWFARRSSISPPPSQVVTRPVLGNDPSHCGNDPSHFGNDPLHFGIWSEGSWW